MKAAAVAAANSMVRRAWVKGRASSGTSNISRLSAVSVLTPNRNVHSFDGKSTSTVKKLETFDCFDLSKKDDSLAIPSNISAVQDDADWEKQVALDRGGAFVKSIMENEYETIPDSNGMRVLRNVLDLETGEPLDVFLRGITIPFWQECINAVNVPNMRYRVAALGTPGIGKSTSTSILIRMLLKQGETVVYLVRSLKEDDWYYEFIPGPNNSIVTKVYPEKITRYAIPSLRLASTYYIVDPGETKDSCNPKRTFLPKVILVPSPDSGHWGGKEFTKARNRTAGIFRYLPIWSLEELLAIRPLMCPAMTEDEVKVNYRSFGGVLRHVFGAESTQSIAYQDQDAALEILNKEQVESIARGKMNANDSFSSGIAKSAIMGYALSDDDNGKFLNKKAILISPLVEEKVYTKFMEDLWETMLALGEDGWKMFETYTHSLMCNKERKQLSFKCRICVGKKHFDYGQLVNRELGGCSEIQVGLNPFMEATAEKNARVLFHSVKRNNKLFDFIYKDEDDHFHAFQVTVGKTHSANVTHIEELQEMVGGASKLSIYYLVPSENFVTFVTKPVNPRDDKNSNISCDIWHVRIPNPKANSKPTPPTNDVLTVSISDPPEAT